LIRHEYIGLRIFLLLLRVDQLLINAQFRL